jgi:beta-lactam-binding protein with PASTA domain
MRKLACAAIVALVGLAGCGSDETAQTVTEERTIVEQAPPPETVTETVKAKSTAAPKPASTITVPDVVGENHQYAQDTMQAAGLYNLDERDATGQDRMLLWDRNWVVVSQDPPAGTEVNENATITLSAKKEGE